jgi:G:T/U-mismatch repair DNA glycosylase
MGSGLPPLLAPGLNVVFVGTEPGSESLRTKSYYANNRNSFWHDLFESGLTPTVIAPSEYKRALTLGIGLDDVYLDPRGLRRRIEAAAPRSVCYNSMAALDRVASDDVTRPWAGKDASRWVTFPGALVWALHDSSPTAVAYRALRLQELRALVDRIGVVRQDQDDAFR